MIIQGKRRMKRSRRRDISCKSDEPLPKIPFDLVIEILRRLPAKSLMRFKSVSKQWSSLIYSKYFANLFSKVSSSSLRVYMWLGFFKSPLQDVILSSSSCLDLDITSMSSFVLDQDLTIPAMKGYSISHVYRGLICFSKGPSAQIYNTTTRQMVVLHSIEESKILAEGYTWKTRMMYTIGHDPVHDKYKLFCTVTKRLGDYRGLDFMSEHWVLLLGADVTSGWRKIVHIGSQPHDPYIEGLTISNGRIYYFASVDSDPDHVLLVSVDIDSEEINILPLPDYWSHGFYNYIIDYGGRVAILDHKDFTGEGVMKLIVLEDEEKNRWSRKNLVLHPSQLEMVNSDDWLVEGTTINGEVILELVNATRTDPGRTRGITFKPQATNLYHVLLYNPQKNHIRKVEIKEPSSRYLDRVWGIIGFDDVENLIHL